MDGYYKFEPNQNVLMEGYVEMSLPATVISRYTSDRYNHCAPPHRRYVIVYSDADKYRRKYDDVSEGELVSVS